MSNFTQQDLDEQLKNALHDIDCESMIKLIQKGANINQTDFAGHTPLHEFCRLNNIEGVKLCISKNANLNIQTAFSKLTPLIYAICNYNYEICKLLFEAGADPTIKNKNGKDALWYAKFCAEFPAKNNQKIIDLIKFYLTKGEN